MRDSTHSVYLMMKGLAERHKMTSDEIEKITEDAMNRLLVDMVINS